MNSSMLIEATPISEVSSDVPPADTTPASAVAEAALTSPGVLESVLWILGFMIASQLLPSIVAVIWSIDEAGNFVLRNETLLPMLLVGQVLGVCFSVLVLRLRVGRNWMEAIKLRSPKLLPCVLAVACVPALILVGYGIEAAVESLMGKSEPTKEIMIASMSHYSLWFCLLVVAVGAAVNEELFCRGFLGRGLVGRYGIVWGVLITSIVFGSIHLNLPQGIWACVLGVFLHLAYLATRSLWVPILLHFVNNALAVLVQWALPDFDPTLTQLVMIAVTAYTIAIPAAWILVRLREGES